MKEKTKKKGTKLRIENNVLFTLLRRIKNRKKMPPLPKRYKTKLISLFYVLFGFSIGILLYSNYIVNPEVANMIAEKNKLQIKYHELNKKMIEYKESAIMSNAYNIGIDLAVLIKSKERRYSLPDGLLFLICKQESNFNPRAVSNKGAIGIAQVMHETAVQYQPGISKFQLFDPETNLEISARFLSYLIKKYKNIDVVTSLYYMGEGNFSEILNAKKNPFTIHKYATEVLRPNGFNTIDLFQFTELKARDDS